MDPTTMDPGDMDDGAINHGAMNHGTMGQERMDQRAINHAANQGHPASSPYGMMMALSFHGGCNEVILFNCWKISSVGGLVSNCILPPAPESFLQVGSMIGCFLLGILYEGLKSYRDSLLAKGFRCQSEMYFLFF